MKNRVSILNFDLHKQFTTQLSSGSMNEQHKRPLTSSTAKSPSQSETLKKLIKKGLVYYTKPFLRPKTSMKTSKDSFYLKQSSSCIKGLGNKILIPQNKPQISSTIFRCLRNHDTGKRNLFINQRVKTETIQSQNPFSSFFERKKYFAQWENVKFSDSQFMEFRDISEQTMRKIGVQSQRRDVKLNRYHNKKFQPQWKKHPLPGTKKQKNFNFYGTFTPN